MGRAAFLVPLKNMAVSILCPLGAKNWTQRTGPMGPHGDPMGSHGTHGNPWEPMGSHGDSWGPMGRSSLGPSLDSHDRWEFPGQLVGAMESIKDHLGEATWNYQGSLSGTIGIAKIILVSIKVA